MQIEVKDLPATDIIKPLYNILAHSRVLIPDLDTPYSNFPNIDHSAIELKDKSISAIIIEREQQVHAVWNDLSFLNTVMSGLKNIEKQLLDNINKINQSMDLHQGLVSALSRLPPEILSQIFVDCLPETRHSFPASRLAPMLLTKICRRWREVALDTPSLWCRLSVRVNHKDWQRAVFCCDSWLKRSQGRLLSLTLEYHTNSDSTKLQSLLQPYIHQISTLDIDFVHKIDEFGLVLEDFPALQKLTFIRYSRNTPAEHQFISCLPHSLHTLNMRWTTLEHISFNSAWPHLTNVDITISQSSTFRRVLQLCPNLSSLTIVLLFLEASDEPEVLTAFTHARLRHLVIPRAYEVPPDLFDALSLPGLRVFAVDDVTSWPHEEFKAFLARSNCPLESLIIGTGEKPTDEELEEYVALIPSLKRDSAPCAS